MLKFARVIQCNISHSRYTVSLVSIYCTSILLQSSCVCISAGRNVLWASHLVPRSSCYRSMPFIRLLFLANPDQPLMRRPLWNVDFPPESYGNWTDSSEIPVFEKGTSNNTPSKSLSKCSIPVCTLCNSTFGSYCNTGVLAWEIHFVSLFFFAQNIR